MWFVACLLLELHIALSDHDGVLVSDAQHSYSSFRLDLQTEPLAPVSIMPMHLC